MSNERITIRDEQIDNKESLSVFFRKAGERLQEEMGEGVGKLYKQEIIAQRLDISVEQLRKKIYRKETDRLTRDWIIAICVAYGCSPEMTDYALNLCGEPTLDDSNVREAFIYDFVCEHNLNPANLKDFNYALSNICQRPLDTGTKRKKNSRDCDIEGESKKLPFGEMVDIHEIIDCDGFGAKSIRNKYYPHAKSWTYGYVTIAGEKMEIQVDSNGECQIQKYIEGVCSETDERVHYSQSGIYQPYCYELFQRSKSNKKQLDAVINDTKNYGNRFGVGIYNNSIYIFYEEFNYDVPELNEYFMMEYINGEYILTIRNHSAFMQKYLSEAEYFEYYAEPDLSLNERYESIEDIKEKTLWKSGKQYEKGVFQDRVNLYKRLQKILEEKRQELRDGILVVQSEKDIGGIGNLLDFYGLCEHFACKLQGEWAGMEEVYNMLFKMKKDYFPTVETATVEDKKGNKYLIKLEEIIRAFELGFDDVEQICSVINEKGSIEQVLY